MEVLVKRSIGANDLMWRGDTLFVTETVAKNPTAGREQTVSGVYAFPLSQLNQGKIKLRPYLADFLGNAIHAIDMDGQVTTLQRNGDTDSSTGLLDQPCATLVVGDKLIVSSMDYAGANPGLSVNTRIDTVHGLSVIDLPDRP